MINFLSRRRKKKEEELLFLLMGSSSYNLTFTASGNGNLTPQITFTGTASVFVDGVETALTSTVAGNIAVTTGQTIGYVFSDYDSITSFSISSDPVSGDISGWTLPASLVYFAVSSTSVSGDISGWTLPASLENFYVNSTSVSGDISGWTLPALLAYFYVFSTSVSGDISGWTLPASLVDFRVYSTSVSGDISGWTLPSSLKTFYVYSTSVSYASASGAFTGITTALTKIDFDNCSLSAQHVTNALVDCDTANVTDTATIEIAGNNTAPLAAGLTAQSNLEGRGYTVTVTAP